MCKTFLYSSIQLVEISYQLIHSLSGNVTFPQSIIQTWFRLKYSSKMDETNGWIATKNGTAIHGAH